MKMLLNLFAENVIRFRIPIILVSGLLFVASILGLKQLYFENSTDMWFLKDDPMLLEYRMHKDDFRNDEFLVIGIEKRVSDASVFNAETIALVAKMTDFLDEHRHVDKVRSLMRYQYIHNTDGILRVDNIIPDDREISEITDQDWANMVAIMKEERLSKDLIVSEDLNSTLVSARIIEGEDPGKARLELAQDFNEFIETGHLDQQGWTLHLSGAATINENYFRYSTLDQSFSYPIMLGIMLVILFLLFRTLAGVVFPAMLVVYSVAVTLGCIGALGWPLNMLNMMLPTLLTVIGLADSIHIVVGFYQQRKNGKSPKDAAVSAIKAFFLPCFFTTFTTLIGFIALSSSSLVPVIHFGVEAAFGVSIAFLISVTLLPACLSFCKKMPPSREIEKAGLARFLGWLPSFARTYRLPVAILFGCWLCASVYFITRIDVDTSFERNFKEDFPIRKAIRFFDTQFDGALALEFNIDSGVEGGAKEPAFLTRVKAFQSYIEEHEGTGRGLSLNDYLMEINMKMNEDREAYYSVPTSREMVSQYLLLYSNAGPEEDLTDMISYDESKLRLSAIFKSRPAAETTAWLNEMRAAIARDFPDLNIFITGRTVMFNNMDSYVQKGLISSFSLAFGLIIICFFIVFRSVQYGILAIISNTIPILLTAGFMGAFNIYLDFATMMIAAITIGIAVDDTIHLLWHYVSARKGGKSREQAIAHAVEHAGRAIVLTSIILGCGFLMLGFSSFVPNVYLGLLGATMVICALVADLLLMPAMLSFENAKTDEQDQTELVLSSENG